ncbi:MAG TPA: DUF4352 domain-containing protein [Flexivirga sp.]|uniref:DUF4352 domain-containing protein n=1 Tax=Flexivirga sp. TaxID=1962927 RepID=UPI002BC09145|nr:DUF4352 domain-containing protein [Flexivirga sp.]HWC20859.1 DUF4352 domain-containing protein [Flexivirga sp.]
MTTTAFRRIALGATPAMLIAGALAGCGNEGAPSVQAPATSANSAAAAATDSGVPTAPSTDQSTDDTVPTDTGVPTVSAAPSGSSSTGDPAKVCNDNDTFLTPGAVAPSTKKAKWGKPLDLTQKYGGTVTITPQLPTVKKPSGDDVFGPEKGQVSLLIKVTVKYKSGDKSSIAGIYFTLRDTQKNVCNYASLSEAVPKQEQFDDGDVSKTTRTYSGTLVYEVPANQDYKKYTLLYRADDFDNKTTDAPVAWTN